jgi:hypothetical protein
MENNMGSLPKIERYIETKMGHVGHLPFLLKHNTNVYILTYIFVNILSPICTQLSFMNNLKQIEPKKVLNLIKLRLSHQEDY